MTDVNIEALEKIIREPSPPWPPFPQRPVASANVETGATSAGIVGKARTRHEESAAASAGTGATSGVNAADALIADHLATHGAFADVADTAQALKRELRSGASWNHLGAQQKEALEAICVKMARIVNGDPGFEDHWQDGGGYFRLGELADKSPT